MTLDSNDPRLTAYVLGELDEAARGEIEAALADDTSAKGAELRASIAALRTASELLTAALGGGAIGGVFANSVAGVSDPGDSANRTVTEDPASQRPATEAQAGAKLDVGRRRRRYVALALAAIVLVAITVPVNEAVRSRRLARHSPASGTWQQVGGSGAGEVYRNNLSLVIPSQDGTTNQPADRTVMYTISKPVYETKTKDRGVATTTSPLSGALDFERGMFDASGQQGGQQHWHYGYVAPGDRNVNRFAEGADTLFFDINGGGAGSLNAHGGVPALSAGNGVDSYSFGVPVPRGAADREGTEQGHLQQGNVAVHSLLVDEIQDQLALRPEMKPEALKKLEELQQQVAEERAHNTEAYARIYDNRFLRPLDAPLSTFSIDVDTAAYSNLRRFLRQGSLPPPDSVRIEELVNYFSYQYAPPAEPQDADKPFAVHTEVTACPWNPGHRLVRIALKGREVKVDARPPSNLVFLLDVSGSMDEPNKLPLVKRAMHLLVEKLGENDRVAIVVYAGGSGLVLPSTTANNRETILAAIDNLTPGGSTNGARGIELAYQIAAANQIKEGVNRVILATDGDFNVGVTNDGDLTRLIEDKAKTGVFLTVLGFGMGNLKDSTLERLADKGNGNYGYIDTENEARKLLVEQLSGTLITIAKDVKLQIELNPARVAAYRLLGYENRMLATEDFNDDTKDAGEIGAGHAVTAFYEIVPVAPPAAQQDPAQQQAADKPAEDKPADAAADQPAAAAAPAETTPVDPLKYQRPAELTDAARGTPELLTLKLRYKEPEGATSKLLEFGVADGDKPIGQASEDTRFAASVALFGMLLRHSPHAGSGTLAAVLEMADSSRQSDEHGYRAEFVELVKQAMTLAKPQE